MCGYKGVVVSCLDNDEYDTDCEFEVQYDGSDEKYEVKLVEEWKKGWVVCEGKAVIEQGNREKQRGGRRWWSCEAWK